MTLLFASLSCLPSGQYGATVEGVLASLGAAQFAAG
jgi:hypothetical protein